MNVELLLHASDRRRAAPTRWRFACRGSRAGRDRGGAVLRPVGLLRRPQPARRHGPDRRLAALAGAAAGGAGERLTPRAPGAGRPARRGAWPCRAISRSALYPFTAAPACGPCSMPLAARARPRPPTLRGPAGGRPAGAALLAAVMILPGLRAGAPVGARPARRRRSTSATSTRSAVHAGPAELLRRAARARYTGPGDVTQHYFYAGMLLVPLALLGLRHAPRRAHGAVAGAALSVVRARPGGGLFDWSRSCRASAASSCRCTAGSCPRWAWRCSAAPAGALRGPPAAGRLSRWCSLVAVRATTCSCSIQLRTAGVRRAELPKTLYGAHCDAFMPRSHQPDRSTRLYGPPLAAVGYRNHALQSHVETTYGYNPLELAATPTTPTRPRPTRG